MIRHVMGLLTILLVLAADQGSKYLVLNPLHLQDGHLLTVAPFLNLVLVWNHGITFGLLAGMGGKILFTLVASLMVLALLVWLWRARSWVVSIAVSAIIGGAVGNVIDRLRFGAVVDFLQMHLAGLYYPWVFNVGDAAIVCGVIALMLENLWRKPPVAVGPGEG